MNLRNKILLLAAGAAAGATGGYLYWMYIGCASGTCMITSKPLNSTVYFAVMGALLVNIILPPGKAGKKDKSLS